MPNKQFYDLPNPIQKLMSERHIHFDDEGDINYGAIVYHEKDVCDIVKATIDYLLFRHELPINWSAVEEFIKQEIESLPGPIEKQIIITQLMNKYNRNSIRFEDAMSAAFDAGVEYQKQRTL